MQFDFEEFGEEALAMSGCILGGIVKMCALVAGP